jgi:hypothetical protein
VRVAGGLGNQLFTYAAARRLALVNAAELVIDSVSGFSYDRKYRRQYQLEKFSIPCRIASPGERLEPLSRVRRGILKKWELRLPFERRRYICQEKTEFDPRLLDLRLSKTVHLEGYWQSADYFSDVANTIRNDLRITPPIDAVNTSLARLIRSNPSVAVHVRFFDPPNAPTLNSAPSDYYARAVALIEQLAPRSHFYIFSDQPASARNRIPVSSDRLTLISHNRGDDAAYADMWLMSQCNHFIIANSTFSWWGAWLGQKIGSTVIAPGQRIRGTEMSWGFEGLLPNEWIKL